jgi:hypothetical protein
MKHTLFFSRLAFLLLLAIFVVATGCEEDEDPNESVNNQLVGDWEVESFTIDGTEQMSFSLNSFTMEYTKQSNVGGETDWLLIGVNGATTRIDSDYEIENEGTEIDLDGDDLDIEINGDDLELSGIVGSERWEIRAERD